jgi:hypothetical protein
MTPTQPDADNEGTVPGVAFETPVEHNVSSLNGARRVLLVGQVPELDILCADAPLAAILRHEVRTHFSLVGAPLVASVRPDAVIAPLIQPGWDCVDLACKLHECGFRGTLVICAQALPSVDLVRREIAALCPALKVVVLPESG